MELFRKILALDREKYAQIAETSGWGEPGVDIAWEIRHSDDPEFIYAVGDVLRYKGNGAVVTVWEVFVDRAKRMYGVRNPEGRYSGPCGGRHFELVERKKKEPVQ